MTNEQQQLVAAAQTIREAAAEKLVAKKIEIAGLEAKLETSKLEVRRLSADLNPNTGMATSTKWVIGIAAGAIGIWALGKMIDASHEVPAAAAGSKDF